ncbi:polysaccharide deacetylase family protein [Roseicella frigidaeris]|uniref:polysaccharide deacetylase family protein n=1 Tax=Roseicella frigidaeris TaxID=2230885 RepID=UPI001A9E5C79|nr:polysaccharide deacetylase family protein [Roseicella frigidaeris]
MRPLRLLPPGTEPGPGAAAAALEARAGAPLPGGLGAAWEAGAGWRPAPAIRASLLVHALALGAGLASPQDWPGLAGLLLGNHALLGLGMRPRSALLGPNLTRLPPARDPATRPVALTFDDGPDPAVTPRILDLLDRHGAKASFFVLGHLAERHPALVREIRARGHSVENHTHSHPLSFGAWGPGAMRREIAQAQAAIAAAAGEAPRFFRPPAGIRSPLLDPVLWRAGLRLVTWTRRGYDTACARPERVIARLLRNLGEGDILVLHDRPGRRGTPALAVLPALLEALARRGLSAVSLRQAVPRDAAAGDA